MSELETHEPSSTATRLVKLMDNFFLPFVAIAVFSVISLMLWDFISSVKKDQAIQAAPFLRATAIVTSKESGEKLSVKSHELPQKGDVIDVDQYIYGAVSTGDTVCVQFKSIPDSQQYGTEFVGLGGCNK